MTLDRPRRLRAAVVGAGFIGIEHAAAYASDPDAELVAIVDTDPARAAAAVAAHGGRAYPSVEAMVDRISRLGFEARVELTGADGEPIAVQITRDHLDELELELGQIVWVSSAREREFAET